ncbi:MAG: KH domain-containing protein [Candidatus Peregrinibacteria bacterium]|nr:KH domain-containing protein [Candidatus Peregrinibacteria bacterium]
MDIEDVLKETLEEILKKLGTNYTKILISEDEKDSYVVNIKSDEPSLLIGYHGENIQALQHLLKVLVWKKCDTEKFNILVDVDDYRKRQEDNVIALSQRKVDAVRKTGRKQILPPMSPYFRRKIHLYCMGAGFDDIETASEGEGDRRHIVIKLKS